MFLDVSLNTSFTAKHALIVRSEILLGADSPDTAWIPLAVAGANRDWKLGTTSVRAAGSTRAELSALSSERSCPQSLRRGVRPARAAGSGRFYAFRCLPISIGGVGLSEESPLWLTVTAEVLPTDSPPFLITATSSLRLSPLPRPHGWFPGDAHVHSKLSDGWLEPSETARCEREASGLSWMILADHVHNDHLPGITDWSAYLRECQKAAYEAGIAVCAGAEFSAQTVLREGHALGYALPADARLPTRVGTPRAVVRFIRDEPGGQSFACIAHPYHIRYGWPDWGVAHFGALELATGGGARVSALARRRWFLALRGALDRWAGDARPDYPIATTTTDSHSVPLSVQPGERHVTWLETGTAEPPSDEEEVFRCLREGRAVTSCSGDFGTVRVNGVGPGGVAIAREGEPLEVEFTVEPRSGHQLKELRLHNPYAPSDPLQDRTQPILVAERKHDVRKSFYVGHFVFSRGEKDFDVWTNPVWVRFVE